MEPRFDHLGKEGNERDHMEPRLSRLVKIRRIKSLIN